MERRRDAVEESGSQESELDAVLQHVPLGVLIVEAPSGRVVRMNREAARLLGARDVEDLQPTRYRSVRADGTTYEPHEWPVARTLASGEEVQGEVLELELDDGARKTVSVTSAPVRANGRLASVVAIFEDVTESGRRERAERAFVTNAAHELQTPIAAITSAIDVLQAGAKERGADRDRFLQHIEHAAERLGRLTQALLVLARAETLQEPPRAEVIQLAPLLRDVMATMAGRSVAVRCEDAVAVVANRPLLEQALVNLGDNASKYTTGEIVLAGSRVGDRVAVAVRDAGPGIAPDERARVFDRFARGDVRAEGFGLGLPIVRSAVDALGGELHVESGPEGTSVSILLPGARVRTP